MSNGDVMPAGAFNRWRVAGWSAVGLLMLIPLVAMQFDSGVNWTLSDFIFAAVLMGGTGLALELLFRKTGNIAYRCGVAAALAATFLLIWINGAVGIIGNEGNLANLMFGGVLAVAWFGAVICLFRAKGMSWAMYGASAVQAAVGAVAVLGQMGDGPSWPADVVVLTFFFAGLWIVAGALFHKAAQEGA